jgi:hypothetical protein
MPGTDVLLLMILLVVANRMPRRDEGGSWFTAPAKSKFPLSREDVWGRWNPFHLISLVLMGALTLVCAFGYGLHLLGITFH